MSGKDGFWRFYEKTNRMLRKVTGPAQIGIGRPEGPDIRPADPSCPLCHQRMSLHEIERHHDQNAPTRLHCPSREQIAEAARVAKANSSQDVVTASPRSSGAESSRTQPATGSLSDQQD